MAVAGRFRQLRLLLWKNWLFIIRSWKTTVLQLLAPCFFLVLVTLLSLLPQRLEDVTNPKPVQIKNLPRCHPWNGKGCHTLLVFGVDLSAPSIFDMIKLKNSTQECINNVMEDFAIANGLEGQIEVYINGSLMPTASALQELTKSNNVTQAAVVFTECDLSKPKLNYIILYNATRALKIQQLMFGSPNKPDGRNEIQLGIDRAFISNVLNKPVNITLYTETFPKLFQQASKETKQSEGATVFLFCAITFQFVMMLYNVVSEKDLKLRQGLKLIGLKDSVYWLAWAITGFVIAFLSTCVLMASGYACQLQYFFNTDFFINFLLFLIYSSSMVPLAFFASVFINTIRMAVAVGIMIFVIGMMIISLLGNPLLLTQLYINVMPLVYVLSFLPPFHLSKAMADIGLASSTTDNNGLPKEAYYYNWTTFFQPIKVTVLDLSGNSSSRFSISEQYLPPTYASFLLLIANALLYGVLFWYLDNVIRGNHGISRKWYFFLQYSYWFGDCLPSANRRRRFHYSRVPSEQSVQSVQSEQKYSEERDPLLNAQEFYGTEAAALEIRNLTKVFSNGLCRKDYVAAVNELSFTVQQNKILSLLGHNGAGKSTTINMLTGLLSPNRGDAYFYGLSVTRNLDEIRSSLGVCPQHDVLWSDLTAREHMELFAGMKGIPRDSVRKEIFSLLEQVQLDHVADHRVGTFSGGMKRRLSVAMSFLGDPRIVFLDEPTTGMDPKIRRNIWNLILERKANRVTIMTTHSMEEADILGDTIAIMANGQLRVMGTSINLKNRFAGYNIELVVKTDSVQQIIDLVNTQLPGATLKSEPLDVEDGVLLPYNLSPDCHQDIVPFFRILEKEEHVSSLILDYSISQTTLEEVFMNVTLNEVYRDKLYQPLLRSSSYTENSSPFDEKS